MSAHLGEIDLLIKVDTNFDLTQSTTLRLHFRRPDRTVGIWTAFLIEPTVMGYRTVAGDLGQVGVWSIQPYAASPGTVAWGKIVNLTVEKNLEVLP